MSRAGHASLGSGTRWRIDAAQAIGARSEQQDVDGRGAIRLDDGEVATLVVVADGMGGEAGGRLAAETAVRGFLSACEDGTVSDVALRLRDALLSANAAVHGCAASDERLAGMGCTLVALALARGRATWISVGDSLLLRLRAGRLERLNADHSMGPAFDEAARSGEMTAEEAASHPNRSVLLSALTGRAVSLMDERSATLEPGDRFVLASDGLLTLRMEEVAAVANAADESHQGNIASALVEAVEARHAAEQDNTTVTVVAPLVQAARRAPAMGLLLICAGVVLAAAPGALLVHRYMQRPAEVSVAKPSGEPVPAAVRSPVQAARPAPVCATGQPPSAGACPPVRPSEDKGKDKAATSRTAREMRSPQTPQKEADGNQSR